MSQIQVFLRRHFLAASVGAILPEKSVILPAILLKALVHLENGLLYQSDKDLKMSGVVKKNSV